MTMQRSVPRRRRGPRYVLLAGPDGVGKSALVSEIARRLEAEAWPVVRVHWRPRTLGRRIGGAAEGPVTEPHSAPAQSRLRGVVRISIVLADYLAYRLLHALRRRAAAIIVERGPLDLVVDPVRYRMSGSWRSWAPVLWLAVPRRTLVVLLQADPSVVRGRKPELSVAEIERQIRLWSELTARRGMRRLILRTDVAAPDELARVVCEAMS